MKNYLKCTARFALSLTLASTQLAAAAPVEIKPSSSNQIFRKYIENETVSDAYRSMQWQLINLSTDSDLTQFFLSGHHFLNTLYRELSAEHTLTLQSYSMFAQTNMIKVKSGLTDRYNKLINMIKEVASDIGFSQKAIDNLELYLKQGDVNAFTVSGNDQRIIVVVQSDLLEKLTDPEVRSVLAHELGHIRSLHSMQSQMNIYMMNLIANSISINTQIQNHLATDSQLNALAESRHSSDFFDKQMSHARQSEVKVRADQLFMQSLMKLRSLPEQEKTQILSNYIQLIINVMVEMNANPESIKYFSDLYQNINYLSSIQISIQQFQVHAEVALSAISRSNETSADLYASSENPNENIASAFGKLLGLQFTKEDRFDIFTLIKQQAEDFESSYTEDQRSPYVGSSHPAMILRMNTILKMPSYPSVLFANRFLKLFVLESAIRQRLGQHTELAEVYAIRHKEIEKILAHDDIEEIHLKTTILKSKAFEHNMKQSTSSAQVLRSQHSALINDIVASIVYLGLDKKMNPRFSNAIEHFSYLRETELNSLNLIQEQLANKKNKLNKETRTALEKHIQLLSSALRQPEEILLKLKEALNNELADKNKLKKIKSVTLLKKRLALVELLMTTNDPNELQQSREAVTPDRHSGSVAERRRLPKKIVHTDAISIACRKLLK